MSALIVAVPHDEIRSIEDSRLGDMVARDGILVDLRSTVDPALLRPDIAYWSL